MPIYPGAVSSDTDLYIAANNAETILSSAIDDSVTVIPVNDTSEFPSDGFITIDAEAIKYTGKTATTFTGATRGADGTVAASHIDSSTVIHAVIAAHHNVLKEEIKSIETELVSHFDLTDINAIGFNTNSILRMTLGTGDITFTIPLRAQDGTVTIPAYSFSSGTNLGLYKSAANEFSATTSGVQRVIFRADGRVTFTDQILSADGTEALPGVSFLSDGNTGIRRPGSGDIRLVGDGVDMYEVNSTNHIFSIGGVDKATIGTGDLVLTIPIRNQDGSNTNPAYAFSAGTDLGLYKSAASEFSVTTSGNQRVIFRSDGKVTFNDQILSSDGTEALPGVSFLNDGNTGIRRAASDDLRLVGNGVDMYEVKPASHTWHISGANTLSLVAASLRPNADNAISNGLASNRWSDVRSVLINGADYGFANGYILREYPCSYNDVQTKSPDWMKANANKGIQILNDLSEIVCVISRDGTIYAKQFKPLSELV